SLGWAPWPRCESSSRCEARPRANPHLDRRFYGADSGISTIWRTGEKSTNRKETPPARNKTRMAGRSPTRLPRKPPNRAPRGNVPHTIVRIVALSRPCMATGTIAWRKLTWLMLYRRFPKKLTPSKMAIAGKAIEEVTNGKGSGGRPKMTAPRMIAGPTPIRFAIRPEKIAPRIPPTDERPNRRPSVVAVKPRSFRNRRNRAENTALEKKFDQPVQAAMWRNRRSRRTTWRPSRIWERIDSPGGLAAIVSWRRIAPRDAAETANEAASKSIANGALNRSITGPAIPGPKVLANVFEVSSLLFASTSCPRSTMAGR